ncbi:uncharacterized protein LOC117599167 [Pangasianodon hypophthalmus]|uniref:uncharacterized protein LOC117599167 n=1 Tax=Pangasianodon hypophthalmus TaxID=310915 RepID=UPI0023079F06|nr:uncharacterized protein LOC117599167 [Pangasianodon hypophthalmus]
MRRLRRCRDSSAEMLFVVFPVLMAAAAAAAACGKSECDFPPAPLYYGILGKPVFLHIPIPSNTHRFCLKKDNNVILQGRREDRSLCNVHQNGVELFSSGSVKISRCVKSHSGEYHWETFDSDGRVQCDVTFTLHVHHHSLCQPSAEPPPSSNDANKTSESLLTQDSSSTNTTVREQICVNSKVFLLLCGVMAVFLTLITALCCLAVMLKRTSSPACDTSPDFVPSVDVLYAEVDVSRKGKRNGKEGETVDSDTAIYSEVAQEMKQETGNQTFTTYGLN